MEETIKDEVEVRDPEVEGTNLDEMQDVDVVEEAPAAEVPMQEESGVSEIVEEFAHAAEVASLKTQVVEMEQTIDELRKAITIFIENGAIVSEGSPVTQTPVDDGGNLESMYDYTKMNLSF